MHKTDIIEEDEPIIKNKRFYWWQLIVNLQKKQDLF